VTEEKDKIKEQTKRPTPNKTFYYKNKNYNKNYSLA
jgi:hypothetical protein